ncbi:MAG: response regulator [Chloroflexi bacterium]|nr:response regulator [Chloroflexota bacterium]
MGESSGAQKVRVLVVDDSAFARWALSRKLAADPEIEIIGFGNDGLDALDKIRRLKPDVVTLDLQMPHMDGLTALKRIMRDCPTPVIMVSGHAVEGARLTIEALQLGAVDFFVKASPTNPAESGIASSDLTARVKQAARIGRARLTDGFVPGPADHTTE